MPVAPAELRWMEGGLEHTALKRKKKKKEAKICGACYVSVLLHMC